MESKERRDKGNTVLIVIIFRSIFLLPLIFWERFMNTSGGDGLSMVLDPMVKGGSAQDQVIADQEQQWLR